MSDVSEKRNIEDKNMWKLVVFIISTMVVEHQLFNLDHLVRLNHEEQV